MNEKRKSREIHNKERRGSTRLSYATAGVRTVAVLVLVLVLPHIGRAATFSVNSTDDLPDDVAGDGLCVTAAGTCTLRAAIEESNALAGRDVINLAAGTYVLTRGQLEILDSLGLDGDGANATIIDGNRNDRVFCIGGRSCVFPAQERNPIVNVFGVTVRNGRAPNNTSPGGGIRISRESSLSLSDSVVSNNESDIFGAGISNNGFLQIFSSTIRDNTITGSTGGGGFTANGGGIFNFSFGVIEIDKSTISGNQATRGGGIDSQGRLEIINSTISGNRAFAGGGGIRNSGSDRADIAFSTITNNTANLGAEDEAANRRTGGGILNFGTVSIGNTILAGNSDNRSKFDALYSPDCFSRTDVFNGTFTSFRGNLVGVVNTNCNLRDTIFGEDFSFDMVGSNDNPLDPLLEPLADNGGPTQTHALQSNSPAIDEGTGVTSARFFDCPDTDQRGFIRPVDGDADGTADCDIGAFEFGARPPPSVTCAELPLTMGCTVNSVTDQLCQGTSGPETIVGTDGRDVIHGLDGNDIIEGRRGGDTICGGADDDRLFGQRGDDFLFGQLSDDTLNGGRGTDTCKGGSGNDTAINCE